MARNEVPILYFEICDKRNSGFVLNGTEGTIYHEELNAPSVSWIPTVGFKGELVKTKMGDRDVESLQNTKIRWIKNEDSIDYLDQEKRGVKPNFREDKIMFEKGYGAVAFEGSTRSLYTYLNEVFYCENAPNRPKHVNPIFRIKDINKEAERDSEYDDLLHDAMAVVRALRTKKGDTYIYSEEKIDAMCALFDVFVETTPTRYHALMGLAKHNPRRFNELYSQFDKVISVEVLHGLQHAVIQFDGNSATYVNENKIITNFGSGKYSNEAKMEKLADYFRSKDGQAALTEFRAKLTIAKENDLQNN